MLTFIITFIKPCFVMSNLPIKKTNNTNTNKNILNCTLQMWDFQGKIVKEKGWKKRKMVIKRK